MRQGKKEQLLKLGGAELAQQGRGAKGAVPWAGDAEFALEPGERPDREQSANRRVHKP